jgi:hypothetical protein
MSEEHRDKGLLSDKVFKIVLACAIVITLMISGLWFWWRQKPEPAVPEPPAPKPAATAPKPVQKPPETEDAEKVVDYNKLEEKDPETQELMQQRKEEHGVDKGVDMVVEEDESIKVADTTIPMKEILEKIRLEEGDLLEKELSDETRSQEGETPDSSKAADSSGTGKFKIEVPGEKKEVYGIYVVRPGDNVWNIHFAFLKDYFDKKGITLSPRADEPMRRGQSSGVGKLLKFSEKMVYIYNIRERRLSLDLNLIHPLSKIVVFNLGKAFSLLDQINYENVNRIEFDGETLWLPAQ